MVWNPSGAPYNCCQGNWVSPPPPSPAPPLPPPPRQDDPFAALHRLRVGCTLLFPTLKWAHVAMPTSTPPATSACDAAPSPHSPHRPRRCLPRRLAKQTLPHRKCSSAAPRPRPPNPSHLLARHRHHHPARRPVPRFQPGRNAWSLRALFGTRRWHRFAANILVCRRRRPGHSPLPCLLPYPYQRGKAAAGGWLLHWGCSCCTLHITACKELFLLANLQPAACTSRCSASLSTLCCTPTPRWAQAHLPAAAHRWHQPGRSDSASQGGGTAGSYQLRSHQPACGHCDRGA